MILSLLSSLDSTEDEKFSDRRARWGVTSLEARSSRPDRRLSRCRRRSVCLEDGMSEVATRMPLEGL